MSTYLNYITFEGYDSNNPGDPIYSATLEGARPSNQAGMQNMIDAMTAVVTNAPNVTDVVVTKSETVTTVL